MNLLNHIVILAGLSCLPSFLTVINRGNKYLLFMVTQSKQENN